MVVRTQVLLTPAFAVTDYKMQGRTEAELVLDLSFADRKGTEHYKWTSLNVQLGRLRTLAGVVLKKKIWLNDVRFKPDPDLIAELKRLDISAASTEVRWKAKLSTVYELLGRDGRR